MASAPFPVDTHQVLEAALKKATEAKHSDAPFGLDEAEAALWHQAQAAAYQHALEMMPPPAGRALYHVAVGPEVEAVEVFSDPREAGAAFFHTDIAHKPTVIKTTEDGRAASLFASTRMKNDGHFKSLPTDREFLAGFREAERKHEYQTNAHLPFLDRVVLRVINQHWRPEWNEPDAMGKVHRRLSDIDEEIIHNQMADNSDSNRQLRVQQSAVYAGLALHLDDPSDDAQKQLKQLQRDVAIVTERPSLGEWSYSIEDGEDIEPDRWYATIASAVTYETDLSTEFQPPATAPTL